MLSDRHMYAVNKLMGIQFPDIEGFHSTLLVQRTGFPPVSIEGGFMQDGNIIKMITDDAITLVFNSSNSDFQRRSWETLGCYKFPGW